MKIEESLESQNHGSSLESCSWYTPYELEGRSLDPEWRVMYVNHLVSSIILFAYEDPGDNIHRSSVRGQT